MAWVLRLVEIGAESFMMSASCVHARKLVRQTPEDRTPEELADLFCRQARRRIRVRFRALFRNDDRASYRIARRAMEGRYAWLASGIVPPGAQPGVRENDRGAP